MVKASDRGLKSPERASTILSPGETYKGERGIKPWGHGPQNGGGRAVSTTRRRRRELGDKLTRGKEEERV